MEQAKILDVALAMISSLFFILASVLAWLANAKLAEIKSSFDSLNKDVKQLASDNHRADLAYAVVNETLSSLKEKMGAMDRNIERSMASLVKELPEKAKIEARVDLAISLSEKVPEIKRDLDALFTRIRSIEHNAQA